MPHGLHNIYLILYIRHVSLLLIWYKVTKINNVDFSLEKQINVQSIASQVCIMARAYTMSLDFRCCFSVA